MAQRLDLFKDGVKAVYEGIMRKAYGGDFPAGGYDFPAASILSKTNMGTSHLHVELGSRQSQENEDFCVSEDYDLAFMNARQEEGSATTDSPFIWPNSLARFPGIFGAALKSYCELRAIRIAYHVDIEGLDNWFRDQWELADEFDMAYCTPRLRSTGHAIWGGVSRVLKPMMTMLPATAPGLVVKHHGLHRTMLGEHTLIDWSRISAIAKGCAAQLMADDIVAKYKVERMDFFIASYDLPDSPLPEDVQLNFDYKRVKSGSSRFSAAMETAIQHAKKLEGRLANRYSNISVKAPEQITLTTEEVMHLNGHPDVKSRHDELAMWEPTDEADYDLNMPRKALPVVHDHSMNMMNTINTIIAGRLKHSGSMFPRGAFIRTVISETDGSGAAAKNFRELRNAIRELFADKFLVLIKHLGDISSPGRGIVWVNRLIKMCGLKHKVGSNESLVEIFRRSSYSVAGVRCLGGIAARIVDDIDNWKASNFVMELSDKVLKTGIPTKLVADVIQKKQVYWMNRCRRNYLGRKADKSSTAHMVVSQIRAKMLKNARFEVKSNGEVVLDEQSMVRAFANTLEKYNTKRKKFNEEAPVRYGMAQNLDELRDECRRLDKQYSISQELKMEVMLNHVRDYMAEFIRDIRGTFSRVFSFNSDCDSMDGQDNSTDDIPDYVEDPFATNVGNQDLMLKPVVSKNYGGVYGRDGVDSSKLTTGGGLDPFVEVDTSSVRAWLDTAALDSTLENDAGGDGAELVGDKEEDDDEDVGTGVPEVDLVKELEDDYAGIQLSEYVHLLEEYGRIVPFDVYKIATEKVRVARLGKMRKAMIDSVAGDNDADDLL